QPLVENAVKHGVGMKEDGGTVTIATKEFDDRYEVIVSDDGVGFDTLKKSNDGRTHVGMENVRNRLKTMCNAVLNIESAVGKGTVATITIPKEEN
ncbi:MAG: sensor histidine kinase, partial [Ruminococcus sp.]